MGLSTPIPGTANPPVAPTAVDFSSNPTTGNYAWTPKNVYAVVDDSVLESNNGWIGEGTDSPCCRQLRQPS